MSVRHFLLDETTSGSTCLLHYTKEIKKRSLCAWEGGDWHVCGKKVKDRCSSSVRTRKMTPAARCGRERERSVCSDSSSIPPSYFFLFALERFCPFSLLVRFPFSLWFVYVGNRKIAVGDSLLFFAILYFENNYERAKLLFPERVIILKCNTSPKRGGHALCNRKSSTIKSLLLKCYKWSFVNFDRWTSEGPLEKDSADFVCTFPSVCCHFHTDPFNGDLIFWLYMINSAFLLKAIDLVSLQEEVFTPTSLSCADSRK